MDVTQFLTESYVFRGLDRPIIEAIANLAEVRDFLPGDTLIKQFDSNSDLVILLEGDAVVKSYSGENLTTLGPGGLIGEMSLIDDGTRSATVLATSEGQAAFLPSEVLRTVLEMDSDSAVIIYRNLCGLLCERLRAMNVHLDTAAKA